MLFPLVPAYVQNFSTWLFSSEQLPVGSGHCPTGLPLYKASRNWATADVGPPPLSLHRRNSLRQPAGQTWRPHKRFILNTEWFGHSVSWSDRSSTFLPECPLSGHRWKHGSKTRQCGRVKTGIRPRIAFDAVSVPAGFFKGNRRPRSRWIPITAGPTAGNCHWVYRRGDRRAWRDSARPGLRAFRRAHCVGGAPTVFGVMYQPLLPVAHRRRTEW